MKKSRSSLLVVWNGSLLQQHPIRTFSLEGTCKDLQSMSTSWIQPCASPRFCIQLLLLSIVFCLFYLTNFPPLIALAHPSLPFHGLIPMR